MDRDDSIFLALMCVLIVALGFLFFFGVKNDIKNSAKCKARGGIYYHPYKSKAICLKDAIEI